MAVDSPGATVECSTILSATEPDWSRERMERWWDPGRRLLHAIRRYQSWRNRGDILGRALSKYHVLRHIAWSVISGADIPLNTVIGGGLLIPHPNGIVIHPGSVIGPNCIIFQQATLGTRVGDGAPVIGGDVEIGAGAKLIGPVHIGDHARIGANAVVLTDVPELSVAVGVPAVVVGTRNG